MYTSYCSHCDKNWTNATANCPHCGSPDPSANYNGARENEDITMDEEVENTFTSAVVDAMKLGVTAAAANEANNLITQTAKLALVGMGVNPKALEGPLYEKGMPILGALMILGAAEYLPDLVPKSDFVSKAAKLALTEATKNTVAPVLAQATPMMLALAASGEKMAKLEAAKAKADKEEEFEKRINDDDVEDAAFEIREVQ